MNNIPQYISKQQTNRQTDSKLVKAHVKLVRLVVLIKLKLYLSIIEENQETVIEVSQLPF
jgi:hypothetical protein